MNLWPRSLFLSSVALLVGSLGGQSPGTIKGLVGYPKWAEAIPRVRISYGAARPIKDIVLEMECPGASDFRISLSGDFNGLPWRPMTPRVRWDLPIGKGLAVMSLVFRQSIGNPRRVSAPLVFLLDPNEPERILQGSPTRYVDWSEGALFATGESPSAPGARHDNGEARRAAEGIAKAYLFEASAELPLVYLTAARDLAPGGLPRVWAEWVESSRFDGVFGEGSGAMVRLRLELGGPLFFSAWTPWRAVLGFETQFQGSREPASGPALVVDVRGLPYGPCALPLLVDESGAELVGPPRIAPAKGPWVRHFREPAGAQFRSWLKSRGSEKNPYLVKALGLDRPLVSRVMVTSRVRTELEAQGSLLEGARAMGWAILCD